jgi:hypothetical protein
MIELKRNENRQDHAEESLKDLLVRRIDTPVQKQQDNPQTQLKQRRNDHESHNRSERQRDDLLEPLVEAQARPSLPRLTNRVTYWP